MILVWQKEIASLLLGLTLQLELVKLVIVYVLNVSEIQLPIVNIVLMDST